MQSKVRGSDWSEVPTSQEAPRNTWDPQTLREARRSPSPQLSEGAAPSLTAPSQTSRLQSADMMNVVIWVQPRGSRCFVMAVAGNSYRVLGTLSLPRAPNGGIVQECAAAGPACAHACTRRACGPWDHTGDQGREARGATFFHVNAPPILSLIQGASREGDGHGPGRLPSSPTHTHALKQLACARLSPDGPAVAGRRAAVCGWHRGGRG